MRELLIRYLLGELDQLEHEEVQQRLAESPELRRELSHLRSCLAASCHADDPLANPPEGLAERTTERVACDEGGASAESRRPSCGAQDPPAGVLGWSLADLTVAGGVALAVSMLLFPALGDSRNATRRTVCQNNQYQLWVLAAKYAENNGRCYPRIEPHENAGMFAVRLAEQGYIAPADLALILVCPAAPFADAIRSGQFEMRIPSYSELQAMSPRQLAAARRNTSPFFAYRLPYWFADRYHAIRDQRLPNSPIFSDTSAGDVQNIVSPNHGEGIIQVTCQDGSVKSLTTRTLPNSNDDLFLNALGVVGAGWGRQDVVLGRSEATPAFDASVRSR